MLFYINFSYHSTHLIIVDSQYFLCIILLALPFSVHTPLDQLIHADPINTIYG